MTLPPELNNYGSKRTVNAVDDLGWDKSGKSPIGKLPTEKGLTIEVPPGKYLLGGGQFIRELRDWLLIGTGDSPDEVVFLPPKGRVFRWLNIRDGNDYALANFTIDIRDDWQTATGLSLLGANKQVRSVHYSGWRPNEYQGTAPPLATFMQKPAYSDAETYIVDFYADDRAALAEYPKCPVMLGSYSPSHGTLYVLDSELQNSGEHAIYASRCEGNVRVERSILRNNQNTQVRISGAGSYVVDSLLIWDGSHSNIWHSPNEPKPSGGFQAQTGLTFESGFQGFAGGRAENCRFVVEQSAPSSGVIKVDGSHGGATVRDCSIHVGRQPKGPAINVEAPGDSHMAKGKPDTPWEVLFENVDVIHQGGHLWDKRKYDSAVRLNGRDATFRNVCVDTTSGPLNGMRLDNGTITFEGENSVEASAKRVVGNASREGWTEVQSVAKCSTVEKELPMSESEEPTISYAHEALIRADSEAETTPYEFTASGAIGKVLEGADKSEPVAEQVVENDDGTYTANGVVADGGGDRFEFDGEVESFTAEGDRATLVVDGDEWAPPEEELAEQPAEEPTEEEEPQTLREHAETEGYRWLTISDGVVVLTAHEPN